MKSKTIKIYSDAGHAWAKIKRIELFKLDILDKISHYSYQKNDFVFLEEDSDLSIYIEKLKNTYKDIIIKFNVSTSQKSKIRNYNSFTKEN